MDKQQGSFWFTPKGFASMGLIGAVSYFLIVEHRQHLYEWLPFLILALCPLMHIFMHGGHGKHEDHKSHGKQINLSDSEQLEDAYKKGVEEGKKQTASNLRRGD